MSYQLMFQKAVELQQNGALNEAEQIYRQILETAPENADVLNLLGLIAQTKGIHQEAVSYFYRAAESAPNHFPIFFNLGVSLGALGKNLEATEAFLKVLKLKPDCKEAYFALGNIYWQEGKIAEAADEFNSALKIDADFLPAKINLAEISNDEAELQKLSESSPEALFYLARRKTENGDYAKAEQYLKQADEILQSDEIKALLGECLVQNDRKDEALRLFYQAFELNCHNLTAVMNIADLENEKRNFKEAEKFYKKALEIDFTNLRVHTNYADMLYKCKRTVEALEEYRQAVIISPKTPELSYNLAVILKDMKDYEQSLDLMFYAYYLAPEHKDWSLNIAETLIMLNAFEPEKARKICENWYAKMPDNVVVKHLRASLNHQENEYDKEYNELLFDNFAQNYEQTLKNINYRVIDKICELYAPLKGKILDLGCGTGLLAEKLKTSENRFWGVDISAKMLQKAEEKKVYEALVHADICEYLKTTDIDFDLITAADVFCYLGNLENVIELCGKSPLLFSVEISDTITKYELQDNGRYKHNRGYVAELLAKYGYDDVKTNEIILRSENGQDVNGMLFMAAKKS